MKYMLMCCIDEKTWQEIPEPERERIMRDYGAWVQALEDDARHVSSARLQSSRNARTVRQKNGKALVTDGPFAETKEQFGGYHVVECADFDEAVELAERIPTLPVGGAIEVRELAPTH